MNGHQRWRTRFGGKIGKIRGRVVQANGDRESFAYSRGRTSLKLSVRVPDHRLFVEGRKRYQRDRTGSEGRGCGGETYG